MSISERIFYLLDKNNQTQKELSEYTGIKTSTISEWKKKGTNPSSDKISRICDFFEVSPNWLLTGEGDMYINQDKDLEPSPQKGQVVFTVKGYGGKMEVITISEEDYEASKPLLERMRQQYQKEWGVQDKRKNKK